MAAKRDFDRHSWAGSSAGLTASRLHYQLPDFVIPLRVLRLDPADRAVLRIAGQSVHFGHHCLTVMHACYVPVVLGCVCLAGRGLLVIGCFLFVNL